jgi:hypothetical protein
MTSDRSGRVAQAVAVAALIALPSLIAPAHAQGWVAGEWRLQAQLYGWLPAADQPAAMPAGRVRRPGLFFGAPPGQLQVPVTGVSADLASRGWAWSLAGDYPVIDGPRHELHLLGGVRQLSFEGTAGGRPMARANGLSPFEPTSPFAAYGAPTVLPSFWDGIVGARGRVRLGDGSWFLPYYLDVGAGQSDLTWQAMGGVGYAFSWGEVIGGYRHLDYRFQPGSPLRDLSFSGPGVSLGVRW